MEIKLTDCRVAFLWAETVLDGLLGAAQPSELAFLGQRFHFAPAFERARSTPITVNTPLGLSLSPPWPKPSGQRFWRAYLEKQSLTSLTGAQAWKAMVPLHGRVPFPVTHSLAGVELSVDAYFYPFGLGLLVGARFAKELALAEAVRESIKLRRDPVFTLQLPSAPPEAVTLDALTDRIMNALRESAWGGTSAGRRSALDPFTLFTVVRGTGVDPKVSPTPGAEIQRALEALTNWSVSWAVDNLPPLEQARVSSHNPPLQDSRLVYAGRRGRALWFPFVFTASADVPTLACYHRNLTLASLQTESLCGFVREVAKRIAQGGPLGVAERECARNAAGLLGRLYGGGESIYRSWSVRTQIARSGLTDQINSVRASFGMTPLAS